MFTNTKFKKLENELKSVNETLEHMKEMLDFKVHSDYFNKTGRYLYAPWDVVEDQEENIIYPFQNPQEAAIYVLDNFCEFGKDYSITAPEFFKVVLKECKYKGIDCTAIEVRDSMVFLSKFYRFKVIKNGSYTYKGIRLKEVKDEA